MRKEWSYHNVVRGNLMLPLRICKYIISFIQVYVFCYFKGDLRLGESRNISFSLENTGDSTSRFIIAVSNDKSNISVQSDVLGAGEIYNAVVMVTPETLQPM